MRAPGPVWLKPQVVKIKQQLKKEQEEEKRRVQTCA